jgi:hypothetical protein
VDGRGQGKRGGEGRGYIWRSSSQRRSARMKRGEAPHEPRLVSREISCLKEACDFGWGPGGREGRKRDFNSGEGELRWTSAHKND